MVKVFISYRRDDTSGYSGRLYNDLKEHLVGEVFMDIDSIPVGVDFAKVIEGYVESSDVLIALIGKSWLKVTDESGRRRLDNKDDFVRLEIAAALRKGKMVIPTLVQGAGLPRKEELPEDLQALVGINAIEISDQRWYYDVERLVKAIKTSPVERRHNRDSLRSILEEIQASTGMVPDKQWRELKDTLNTSPSEDPITFCRVREEEYFWLRGAFPWDHEKHKTAEGECKLNNVIDKMPVKFRALCLSGDGMRSVAYTLGVLQGLARFRLLDKFDYLSTVAGGGYIGGWLMAWVQSHPFGFTGVLKDLNLVTSASEPEPLRNLRKNRNFITRKAGLLSEENWTSAVIYLRNLLLNWVVLIPLAASVLMVPRVSVAVLLASPGWRLLAWLLVLGALSVLLLKPGLLKARGKQALLLAVAFLIPLGVVGLSGYLNKHGWGDAFAAWGWNAPSALLVAGTLLGGYVIAFMRLNRPSSMGVIKPGSFWARHKDQNSFLWLCLLPLCVSAWLLTTFWAWFRHAANNGDYVRSFILGPRSSKLLGFPNGFPELLSFLVYGLLLGLASWLIYLILSRSLKEAGRELAVMLLISLICALLLFFVAVNVYYFYTPFAGPLVYSFSKAATELRPYSDWWGVELYVCFALPSYLFITYIATVLFVGLIVNSTKVNYKKGRVDHVEVETEDTLDLADINEQGTGNQDDEWLTRVSAWLFIVIVGWMCISGLVIFGPLLYATEPKLLSAITLVKCLPPDSLPSLVLSLRPCTCTPPLRSHLLATHQPQRGIPARHPPRPYHPRLPRGVELRR
jgi:hypothetical protein